MDVLDNPIRSAGRAAVVWRGRAAAPGTCGELVQGTLRGEPFLITCPVDLWSEVSVELSNSGATVAALDKSSRAARLTLQYLGAEYACVAIKRVSVLPESKGMGSSTADIAATCQATARALGRELEPAAIAKIAAQIEPSDGQMFPGITIINHLTGEAKKYLGPAPPLNLVVADPGGVVDTVVFNRRQDLASKNFQKEPMVKQAMELVTRGLLTEDWEMMGRGATISAQANQVVLPKPHLALWRQWAADMRALGVLVAHSGTVMGMILRPGGVDPREAADFVRRQKPDWTVWHTSMISGGLR
ncbi:GHMP kinase [Desulforamulus hydrothermalis]|uniref:GHMP kinase n=1 Tax=Desulforamulus hydrothermalis Lam5 = DSM 18033 TaxID=1121428 RepID=K8EH65_9FIRM|nr:GHMP kinase [Desulforamulus hydrothermalis]CCO07971.1 GHMP kinase [Desulforamulus hydrothermalis Lam5 = DSM 18033]SHG85093.1 threonine kinase [Desulforamulus hydrothermalis Lam5 = DSM 18033]